MKKVKNIIPWFIFGVLFVFFLAVMQITPVRNSGGDIVEYFGMNESLLKNQTVELTQEAKSNLEHALHPGYFTDTNSEQNGGLLYYMRGRDGKLYPVHFFFYSLLNIPARLVLHAAHLNELNTLRFTNLLILFGAAFVVMKYFATTFFKRMVFLTTLLLSPVVSFVIWPGPDVYYISLLLVGVFLFFERKYLGATLLAILASWHSQPLIILCLGVLLFYIWTEAKIQPYNKQLFIRTPYKTIGIGVGMLLLLLVPYLYNYITFGVLTPWTILKDGWTALYGFGLHNASFQKLFEQFFDLNMGLFWYAPLLLIGGGICLYRLAKEDKRTVFVLVSLLITAFFYQTNPAWHYGTAGFGPTRHILFVVPFLVYALVRYAKPTLLFSVALCAIVLTQVGTLFVNGFVTPDFMNVLKHSPYAEYVLNNHPSWYNPNPEIFVDRTNHTDLKYLHTAIYQYQGECTKAYVLKSDRELLEKTCGKTPDKYRENFDDPYARKANYSRKTKVRSATFWPDPVGCAKEYVTTPQHPYVCMRTQQEAQKHIGLSDPTRLKQVENLTGVWRIEIEEAVEITIPAGYFIQYTSLEGFYVDYK